MFSFIIPTINDLRIYDTIASILNSAQWDEKKYEVIIIANGCKKNFFDGLKKKYLNYKSIQIFYFPEGNIAKARNIGIKAAKGKYIIHLDSDCILDNNYIPRLKTYIQKNKFQIARGYVKFMPQNNWLSRMNCRLRRKIYDTNFQEHYTPNLIIRKYLYKKVGLFDEGVFYGEDTEWGLRFKKSNIPLMHAKNLVVIHYDDFSFKKTLLTWIRYGIGWSYRIKKQGIAQNKSYLETIREVYFTKKIQLTKSISFNLFAFFYIFLHNVGTTIGLIKWRRKNLEKSISTDRGDRDVKERARQLHHREIR